MANPQDDEIVRQMKMMEDLDTEDVKVPEIESADSPPESADLGNDVLRQMEMLQNLDTDDVEVPDIQSEQPPLQTPSLTESAQQASEREQTNILSPENAPEVFASLSGGGDSLQTLIELVRNLPREIAQELRQS